MMEGTGRMATRMAGLVILLSLCLPAMVHAFSGTVLDIRMQGLYRVEQASVEKVLYSRVGAEYGPATIQKDIKAIYKLGKFQDVQVDVAYTDKGVILTYILKEQPSIRKVALEGNDEVDEDDIMEVVDVKPYSVLSHARIYQNIDKIRNVYIDKGFYLAEIESDILPAKDNQVDVTFKIKERAKVVVKKVILQGNEKISDKELEKIMLTKPGDFLSFLTNSGKFREEAVERDRAMIEKHYGDHGYVNARIGTPQVYISPDRTWIYVTFPIVEGEQFRMGDVDFFGDLLFPKEQLKEAFTLKKGQIFNRSRFIQDFERITAMYKDLGYAYANVSPLTRQDKERRILNFDMQIQKGGKVWIERIHVVGNDKTRDKVVRREMRIAEGDLYSSTDVRRSKAKVYQLGYFETVEINEEMGSRDDRIVLTVEVKERRTGTFQLGFGFSSIDSFVFQSQINQNNLFGRGQSLSLMAQVSSRQTQFSLSFFEPYLADTRLQFGFKLFSQSLTYPRQGEFGSYSRKNYGLDLTFGYPFWENITLYLTYSIQNTDINVANMVHIHLFKSGFTSSFTATAQYDTRNNRLFPTKGMLHRLSAEFADAWTGSEIEFMKFTMHSQYFFPIFWKLVFKINTEVGYVTTLEEPFADLRGKKDFPGVPIAERYLLGGIFTIRGFEYGSISPSIEVIPQDDPVGYPVKYLIGGNKELIANFELEFPIIEQAGLKWVFFYDAGNTWSEEEQFFYLGQSDQNEYNLPMGLYMSYGFGFRWYSPIGPLRFEWGLPITRRPQDGQIGFEFSIGNQF